MTKQVPTPGIEPGPPAWKAGILTTRPYGRTDRMGVKRCICHWAILSMYRIVVWWLLGQPCCVCCCLSSLVQNFSASAGSRTRIDCLEGNHANRYTTDANTLDLLYKLMICTPIFFGSFTNQIDWVNYVYPNYVYPIFTFDFALITHTRVINIVSWAMYMPVSVAQSVSAFGC